MRATRSFVSLSVVIVVTGAPLSAGASATFVVQNADGAGVGFNDVTPVTPVGGNSGVTLGEQRLKAVQYAADLWGKLLDSAVPIVVRASFKDLPCTVNSGAIGHASTNGASAGITVPGADPQLYYPAALANRLTETDLFPDDPEIVAEFNSAIGTSACLPSLKWYYGLDGNFGKSVDLVAVVLHELGHGLGFTSLMNVETGTLIGGRGDIFTKYIYDKKIGRHWTEMSENERVASSTNVRNVVWDGPNVTAQAAGALASGVATLSVSPAPAGFSALVSEANFGPPLSSSSMPIQAELVLGNPSDGCQQLTNAAGKVVLLFESGTCHLCKMVSYAEADGALAVLIARDIGPNSPPKPLDADCRETLTPGPIGIPPFSITASDANLLKTALGAGTVTVKLASDPSLLAGADASGRVFLNATDPINDGSSINHWDPLVRPNLLMEPAKVQRVSYHDVDLSLALLKDIGWSPACGNGRLDGEEACDNGNSNSSILPDACRHTCVKAYCGDGARDTGEQCDWGSGNSDAAPDACRTNCRLPTCSDGVRDAGEQCSGDNATSDSGQVGPDADGTPTHIEAGTDEAVDGGSGLESDGGTSAGNADFGGTGTSADLSEAISNRDPVPGSDLTGEVEGNYSEASRQGENAPGCGCRVAGVRESSRSGVCSIYLLLVATITLRRRRSSRVATTTRPLG
jgi:hypothetical protein